MTEGELLSPDDMDEEEVIVDFPADVGPLNEGYEPVWSARSII